MKRFLGVVIADYEYIKRSLWNYVWLSNYNFSLPISQLDLPSWKTISFFKVGWTFNYRLETVRSVCKKKLWTFGHEVQNLFWKVSKSFGSILGQGLRKSILKAWDFSRIYKIMKNMSTWRMFEPSLKIKSISDNFASVKVIFGQSWWFIYFPSLLEGKRISQYLFLRHV